MFSTVERLEEDEVKKTEGVNLGGRLDIYTRREAGVFIKGQEIIEVHTHYMILLKTLGGGGHAVAVHARRVRCFFTGTPLRDT